MYVVHWDEETQEWGTPMNLGADVNTEGNEIFPVLYEGRPIFSSNGLPGFGGYDLFNADYDHEGVVISWIYPLINLIKKQVAYYA